MTFKVKSVFHLGSLIIAAAYFVVGIFTLQDYGMTTDELEAMFSAQGYFDALLHFGSRRIDLASAHAVPGYHFVSDSLMGAFIWITGRYGFMGSITAMHFYHLILASFSLYLLFLLVEAISHNERLAFLSTLTLALFPQFIAHSQNNPKDLPTIFVFLLTSYGVVQVLAKGGVWRAILTGVAWALTATTNFSSAVLVPILGLWLWVRRKESIKYRPGLLVIMTVTAILFFFVMWPVFWYEPFALLTKARFAEINAFTYTIRGRYLNHIYNEWELPWHWFGMNFIATTPVLYIVAAMGGMFVWFNKVALGKNVRDVSVLGIIWCLTTVVAERFINLHYDGIRHFLFILPAFSMLVAIGVELLLTHARKWAVGVVLAGYSYTLIQMVHIHPYQNAYLNEAVNAAIKKDSELYFEIEYWGHAYKEGAEWLNAHAEQNAEIWVPTMGACAYFYLNIKPSGAPLKKFLDPSKPRYLMTVTRINPFLDFINDVHAQYQPVFEIKRQNGTLLRIYKNDPSTLINNEA